jgi:hypothetical protein
MEVRRCSESLATRAGKILIPSLVSVLPLVNQDDMAGWAVVPESWVAKTAFVLSSSFSFRY